MKRLFFTVVVVFASVIFSHNKIMALNYNDSLSFEQLSQHQATITFRNKSDYDMTLKILYALGGYYTMVSLPAHV